MKYLNVKTSHGVETVDQVDPKDFKNNMEFKGELLRLRREYILAGINVYVSQRCDASWNS